MRVSYLPIILIFLVFRPFLLIIARRLVRSIILLAFYLLIPSLIIAVIWRNLLFFGEWSRGYGYGSTGLEVYYDKLVLPSGIHNFLTFEFRNLLQHPYTRNYLLEKALWERKVWLLLAYDGHRVTYCEKTGVSTVFVLLREGVSEGGIKTIHQLLVDDIQVLSTNANFRKSQFRETTAAQYTSITKGRSS